MTTRSYMKNHWLRSLVFGVLRYSGLSFLFRELLQRNRVTILCYHDPSREAASRHFEHFSRTYNIISLQEYVRWRVKPEAYRLPAKSMILTFDDGHQNNFALVDIFRRLAIPTTIFVCSAIVGTRRHFWWKGISDNSLAQALKYVSDEERLEKLAAMGLSETMEHPERQALSMDELKALSKIVDIQSHSRLHPILPRCSGKRVQEEMAGSKEELERKLGNNVYAFAYPNGDFSDREINSAKDSGYQCALGLGSGYNNKKTNLFCLRRITMNDESDLNEAVVRASGLWGCIERLRRW